jgi:hypothetical protein
MSNLHLFHGVEAVVFVEGGKTTYTLEQVSQGLYNPQADDLKYWQVLFKTFAQQRTVHFRAVGSKNTITELAALIIAGSIRHVIVAMDRDLDHVRGSLHTGGGVLSTIGYSWENDVWTVDVVFEAFKKFSTAPESEKDAEQTIREGFENARRKLKHCVRTDVVLGANKLDPLPREKFEKILRPVRNAPPTISSAEAKAIIRLQRRKSKGKKLYAPGIETDTLRDCHGHLLGGFGYHLLVHALNKFCGITLTPRQLLVPAAIDAFGTLLPNDPTLRAHYAPQFAAINWA